jgi:hypothetical protein
MKKIVQRLVSTAALIAAIAAPASAEDQHENNIKGPSPDGYYLHMSVYRICENKFLGVVNAQSVNATVWIDKDKDNRDSTKGMPAQRLFASVGYSGPGPMAGSYEKKKDIGPDQTGPNPKVAYIGTDDTQWSCQCASAGGTAVTPDGTTLGLTYRHCFGSGGTTNWQ